MRRFFAISSGSMFRAGILLCSLLGTSTALWAAEITNARIEVFKSKRELQVFSGDELIKTYRVALGTNPVPAKVRQGDRATPEGTYFICLKNAQSKFHLSLAISYPGPDDARRGLKDGLITRVQHDAILRAHAKRTAPPWDTRLGGEVFVHGSGSAPDWTWGCVALDNPDIEELYKLIPLRTPISIHP